MRFSRGAATIPAGDTSEQLSDGLIRQSGHFYEYRMGYFAPPAGKTAGATTGRAREAADLHERREERQLLL